MRFLSQTGQTPSVQQNDDSQDVTRMLWSKQADLKERDLRRYDNWMHHPAIAGEYINKKFGGDNDRNWLTYFAEKYASTRFERGITLGCGGGGLERHALYLDVCKDFQGYDIAPGAIEVAIREATLVQGGERLNYQTCNLNTMNLKQNECDVVFACQSAHHFENLEHIFAQVEGALRPGGLFVLNEFIGPTRFQWTDKQLELANDMLGSLPARYKQSRTTLDTQKSIVERPTLDMMIKVDPSEAIRSAEILAALQPGFDIVERIDFGGTLLHILLQDIVGNFDPDVPEDMLVLQRLWELEDRLITEQVIDSDFAFIVARVRKI